ncbi:PsbP-domain-containing protein [Baffinella frigidus]|nr:PsbP-domain-containing protein [Cryptophyta sp. CCMP2293]
MLRTAVVSASILACAEAFTPGAALPLAGSRSAATASKSTVNMCAQQSAVQIPSRRAILKAASAASAVLMLGIVPGASFAAKAEVAEEVAAAPVAAAPSDWMEVEDANGKITWYNAKTQKTSALNPTVKGTGTKVDDDEKAQVKFSRMGGVLTQYKDTSKGFQLMRPSGWNEFQNAPGEYDVKWEDLVERTELAMVGSNPVKSATSVEALGTVDKVAASLAKKKKAKVIEAVERTDDNGIKYYTMVFQAGEGKTGAREVYTLCVYKGRLWSVTTTTSEKRWARREDLYKNMHLSFIPKL